MYPYSTKSQTTFNTRPVNTNPFDLRSRNLIPLLFSDMFNRHDDLEVAWKDEGAQQTIRTNLKVDLPVRTS